ncbi:MAG: HRDC domain-containing protein [Luteolibacter sp.]|nr:HRDC domain-containing protein [Luteolibacter sp.]
MIETTEHLVLHLEKSRGDAETPICAIDTEADSLHRYRESLCLVQFAVRDGSVLIDPLAIENLSPLGEYLSQATVWMHGADYDMTMFKRQFGELPAIIYDTQIGARLLGVRRFGLGDLVKQYFGVELSKSSQKADWGNRPLSPKMVEYALNDVHYLLEMGDIIVAQLRDLGRYDWFEESCVAARRKVLERDDTKEEMWRIQGSGKLDRRGLACLRALWQWRDAEAKTWDRPSFMVVTNRELLEWSHDLASGKCVTLPHHFRPDRLKRFRSTVAAVEALSDAEWPERPAGKRRKRDRDFDRRVDALIRDREQASARLDIEGSLIASRAVLESIAADDAMPSELLLRWQLECLGLTD